MRPTQLYLLGLASPQLKHSGSSFADIQIGSDGLEAWKLTNCQACQTEIRMIHVLINCQQGSSLLY